MSRPRFLQLSELLVRVGYGLLYLLNQPALFVDEVVDRSLPLAELSKNASLPKLVSLRIRLELLMPFLLTNLCLLLANSLHLQGLDLLSAQLEVI